MSGRLPLELEVCGLGGALPLMSIAAISCSSPRGGGRRRSLGSRGSLGSLALLGSRGSLGALGSLGSRFGKEGKGLSKVPPGGGRPPA